MTGGRRWDVFLAYASPDRPRAQALYDALCAARLSVCFDQAVLRPGDNWHRELPGHLRSSAIIVVLLSSHTERAHFEVEELLGAIDLLRREGARLVPLRLHPGAELPYGTWALHAMDFFDDESAADAAVVIADLARNPGKVAEEPATQVWCARIPAVPPVFAGREELVEHLGQHLGQSTAAVLTQTISGMGGVGKTTVAAALADARRHLLDVVWWVRAEQQTTLVADLAELAPLVAVRPEDDPADTAAAVRNWLEATTRHWLLVFDNAPDEASIEPWRPRRGRGATVVTSRSRNMSRLGEVISVDVFEPEVAAAFLRARVGKRNPAATAEDLSAVLARLNGLPLALEQAAAWVERVPNRRFARYVELFDDAAGDPFPGDTRPLGYEHTAATAWRVSIDAAGTEAPCAERVLAVLGFLAPDDLPCQWLRDLAEAGDPYLAATESGVDAGLAALHGYSLVDVSDADTVSVHRVIQAATRRSAPNEAAGAAISLLRGRIDGDARDHTKWPTRAALAPHALAAASTAGAALPERANDLWWVLNDLTVYHDTRGAAAAAIEVGTLALQLATTHLGADLPNTLTSRNSLATAYHSAGDHDRAIPLFEATLTYYERVLGPDHPNTLSSRNNLATAYQSAGDLDRAIPLLQATLADRERVLGPTHPDTLTSRNNLAFVYRADGDFGRAISMSEATLADRERVLGPDHPDTLVSRNNLAGAYFEAGDLDRAIPLLEATLADRERVLGADHPNTLTSRHNLAGAYRTAGDLDRAIPLYETTLADSVRILGADHPRTRTTRANLAAARRPRKK